jgi:hypothetical protein
LLGPSSNSDKKTGNTGKERRMKTTHKRKNYGTNKDKIKWTEKKKIIRRKKNY